MTVPCEHDISLASVGIGTVDLSGLEAMFSEEEIFAAIEAMSNNKSTRT